MIPVVTIDQMRSIDNAAIGNDVAAGYTYMKRAGEKLFLAVREYLPNPSGGEVAVVCGTGNNGGDGFVVARLLIEAGYRVMCFCTCAGGELKNEAKEAFDEFIECQGNFLCLDDAGDLGDLGRYAVIVDALLGTGSSGHPRALVADAINAINASGATVIAVDTPSGVDCRHGTCGQPSIKATMTVMAGFPKTGLYFYPLRGCSGELRIADLAYPPTLLHKSGVTLSLPDVADLRAMLPPRKPWGSKYDHGVVATLCGSTGMIGAATLVAKAAMRCGCGLVHCCAPVSTMPVLEIKCTEPILHPIAETNAGSPSSLAFDAIREVVAASGALCIGPGISHHPDTIILVQRLLASSPVCVVLDADGLNAFKADPEKLVRRSCPLVITPHRGEWTRVFGELPSSPEALVAAVLRVARDYNCVVLLKGSPTIIAEQSGSAWLMPYGTSALSTAGSGDVLAGVIVSLIAQGCQPAQAALLGSYLHARAGSLVAQSYTEYGVIASDLVETLPRAIAELLIH